ncbi:hypothetical protein L1987_44057 [Smallanthus sonchifolius]|uniref:Uncharacterized protein n=1 Tax=Smallanthus sonchifolius TaxID=185202 RepID=A0ACB9GN74_9ASTR|nr:hypothetical protein L1987_44057 [Smallanthus sonchifolius]
MVISSLLYYFHSFPCRPDESGRSFHCVTWTSPPAIHHRPRRSFHTGRTTTTVVRPGRRRPPAQTPPSLFTQAPVTVPVRFFCLPPLILNHLILIASEGLKHHVFEVSLVDLQNDEDHAYIRKIRLRDEDLMNMLFSFLEPEHPHSTLLAGYFSKVVVCLLLRKTLSLMNYVQVLIRLIGGDEHLYTSYVDSMQWLEDTDALEMIVD